MWVGENLRPVLERAELTSDGDEIVHRHLSPRELYVIPVHGPHTQERLLVALSMRQSGLHKNSCHHRHRKGYGSPPFCRCVEHLTSRRSFTSSPKSRRAHRPIHFLILLGMVAVVDISIPKCHQRK